MLPAYRSVALLLVALGTAQIVAAGEDPPRYKGKTLVEWIQETKEDVARSRMRRKRSRSLAPSPKRPCPS